MPASRSPTPLAPPPPAPPFPLNNGWRLDTFRALRHPNYRLFFAGQLVSVLGSWVQTAALAWLAHARTGEAKWTALIAAVQMLPTAILGVWGGSLAERLPRRAIIFFTQISRMGAGGGSTTTRSTDTQRECA
jgi:hypothetical protein